MHPIDPVSLGLTASEKRSLNDDRVARSLDALVTPRARTLLFRLALHIIEQFELDTRRIHQDTTTVTFTGLYGTSKSEPRITRGINKDHRPDLKQLVFGLSVTADGAVPIAHDIYSGNRTDDTIHRSNVDRLREVLRRTDFTYVADSKLATRKNLAHVAQYGGTFVTVLPRTRAEDKRFRKSLRAGTFVRWRKLIEIEDHRRKSDPPDVYYSTADGPRETSEGYRIVWVRSSQKSEHDALARETSLEKAETELFDLNTRVYHLDVSRNKKALRAEARTDGVFPLITNLKPSKAPKQEVLLIYKYQPYVEKRHALFKSELEVAPVYIKKPLRAAGLLHAVFLAMTLDASIERTVRFAMVRDGIEALPILPEGRYTKTPTTARILEMFSDVCWYEFERGDDTVTFPIQLSQLQKQLLQLLDMSPSAYA